jgi:Zn-dependent protease
VGTDLEQALIFFATLVAAIILHEVSHGVAALAFGDDTAKRAGRLTLNPVPHIDPFGSILLPAMGALAGLPVFGWAKPVPINPTQMRNPRRDSLYVSLAGPASNFVLMVVAALAARALFTPETLVITWNDLSLPVQILFSFAMVNLFLGLFNLLPIPPLDGAALIERVLPVTWLANWHRFRPYGFLVLFVLVFATGFVGRLLDPFYDRLVDFVFL